jgi:hypothetical protein
MVVTALVVIIVQLKRMTPAADGDIDPSVELAASI